MRSSRPGWSEPPLSGQGSPCCSLNIPNGRIFCTFRTSIEMSDSNAVRQDHVSRSGLVGSSHSFRDLDSVLNSDFHQPLEGTGSSDGSSLTGPKISVVVVAAEQLFALGLARLLGEDECLDVIGVSDGEPDVVELCLANSVDVVLIDLEHSRANSIDIVRLLASECPATRTLVLTSNPDWRVRPAMLAGAAGVLLKDTSPEATRAAVVSVHLGDQILCSEAARWVLGEDPSAHLTQRESDVLRIMAQGANNAEIARQLELGQKTVRNYVSRLYRKLDLNNRAQLATYLAYTDIAPRANRNDSTLDPKAAGRTPADSDGNRPGMNRPCGFGDFPDGRPVGAKNRGGPTTTGGRLTSGPGSREPAPDVSEVVPVTPSLRVQGPRSRRRGGRSIV